ncbi:MAG: proton-conducting transporter membrane subunit [Haloarculaceae archaeon]
MPGEALLPSLVAVPLLGATVPVLLARRRERLGWPVALVVSLVHAALAAWTALVVLREGPVAAEIGGIPAPFGIALRVDALSVPFLLLVAGSGLAVLAYTRVAGPRSGPFYGLYLLLVGGLTGVCVTADAFNLYVFLEISGLASYGLVARSDRPAAAVAALQYLLVGTVGASLYLFGVGYAYVATGVLSLRGLAAGFAAAGHGSTLVVVAFVLVVVGLAVKLALFPLHVTKPDAYAVAPTGVAALLAALASTVAGYALLRLLLSAFTYEALRAVPALRWGLFLAAGASVAAGSLLAFRATEVRRLLAYSSVTQYGLAAFGLAVGTRLALVGAVIQLVGHAVMKGGLYLAVGVISARTGAETVDGYAGVAEEAPGAGAAVAVLALGMVGIPPTVGFAGKLYIAAGAFEAGLWPVAAVVLASTLLSLAYFGRLIQRLYVDSPGEFAPTGPVSTGMAAAVAGAATLAVVLGLGAAGVESALGPALEGVVP